MTRASKRLAFVAILLSISACGIIMGAHEMNCETICANRNGANCAFTVSQNTCVSQCVNPSCQTTSFFAWQDYVECEAKWAQSADYDCSMGQLSYDGCSSYRMPALACFPL